MNTKARMALIVIHLLSIINFGIFSYCQGLTLFKSGVLNPYGALLGVVVSIISFFVWQICALILWFFKSGGWVPHIIFIAVVGFQLSTYLLWPY